MDKEYVLNYLKKNKIELKDKYGVVKIGLFGSYARDEQKEDSDIDIAVELQTINSFRSFFALKNELEKNLGKKIDLGIEHCLKPIAKEYVKKEIIYV